ncbi:MAG: hypothetical protein ACM3VX_06740, partial [Bacteroidota bacterium]
MTVDSFAKFQRWYVKSMPEEEFQTALRELSVPQKVSKAPAGRRRALFRELWQKTKDGVHISRYLLEHCPENLRNRVAGQSAEQIKADLDDLIREHGLRQVALALVMNADERMKTVAFDLVSSQGESVEQPVGEDNCENAEVGSSGATSQVLEALTVIRNLFETAQVEVDRVGPEIAHLVEAWTAYTVRDAARSRLLEEISGLLAQGQPWFRGESALFGELAELPTEAEAFRGLPESVLADVRDTLLQIHEHCREVNTLRAELGKSLRSADEEEAVYGAYIDKRRAVRPLIEQLAKRITALLGVPAPSYEVDSEERFEEEAPLSAEEAPEPEAEVSPEAEEPALAKTEASEPAGEGLPEVVLEPVASETSEGETAEPYEESRPDLQPDHEEPAAPDEADLSAGPAALRPTQRQINALLWYCLGDYRFGEAFWLSYGAQEFKEDEALDGAARKLTWPPSWLVEALVLAENVQRPSDRCAARLTELYLAHPSPMRELTELGVLAPEVTSGLLVAGSLVPALFVPSTGASSWIQEALRHPLEGTRAILEIVRDFSSLGVPFEPRRPGDTEVWNGRAKEAGDRARRWLTQVRNSKASFPFGTSVMRFMAQDFVTSVVAGFVSDDRRDRLEEVKVLLNRMADRKGIADLVEEAAHQVPGKHPRVPTIDGPAREMIYNRLEELRDLAQDWVEAITMLANLTGDREWVWDRTAKTASELTRAVTKYLAESESLGSADSLRSSGGQEPGQAAHRVLSGVITRLKSLLNPQRHPEAEGEGASPGASADPYALVREQLRRPLLLLDEVP